MNEPIPGRVVISRAGHDKGRPLVVLACEGTGMLVLADGRTRTADQPKRKKRMHVFVTPDCLPACSEKLAAGEMPQDHEIRREIEAWEKNRAD